MKKYKIKLGFSVKHFCNTNYHLHYEFFKEIQSVYFGAEDDMEMSDRLITVRYKYNSPVKEIRKIVNKYKKLMILKAQYDLDKNERGKALRAITACRQLTALNILGKEESKSIDSKIFKKYSKYLSPLRAIDASDINLK